MENLKRSIQDIVESSFGSQETVELTRPDEQFGDFSTNIAMKIANKIKSNPRDLAQMLATSIEQELTKSVSEVSIAGPGFINIRLTDKSLVGLVEQEPSPILKDKVVLVEYSDPNPFKPLHAGHLYTTIVGDVIARIIENSSAQTTRLNYGGDVGLHVGKSMWAIVKHLSGENPEKLDEIAVPDRPSWMGARYIEGNAAYEEDEAAKAEIIAVNRRVYEIHSSNDKASNFAKIYWVCRKWSYDYFSQLYEQLKVHSFDRFIPESEVVDKGIETVRLHKEKGIYEDSDGAVIFNGEKFGLHNRVFINSEGLPTYEAKEVGLVQTKWDDYKFDNSIVITANEQEQYMKVVLKSIEQFNLQPAQRTIHITHGVVKLAGGVKMSSRKGNVLSAIDVLDAARAAGQSSDIRPNEDSVLAAVKYAFLKSRIGGDIIYDPDESITLEGNSGPYLQYAHARARSILAKADKSGVDLQHVEFGSDERSLIRKIGEYPEIITKVREDLSPHLICTYLYELAQNFNRFYEHNRVISDERQDIRLKLVELYAGRLKDGLELLGINAPYKM
ncbi:MAG: arginine--tRNA ligase [Candidatus Saccharimonadales bacterium]